MKREQASLPERILLGPGGSIAIALVSLGVLLLLNPGEWIVGVLSVLIGAFGVYQIKARGLYKGPNQPFIGLFMAMQAATVPSLTATLMAVVTIAAMVLIMLLFQHREQTPLIFLIMLVCGLGALGARCFLLLSGALMIALTFVGAFSFRGFVASVLGLLTPAIICIGFGLYNPESLLLIYGGEWFNGFNISVLVAAIPAALFALITFLTAYGYPPKQRARNMAMLSLTATAVALSIADSVNASDYVGLFNLCSAYWVAHFAATRRGGWLAVPLTIAFAIYYALSY